MLPSVNGGLVPAVKVQERREQGANGTVASQKTTLLPDGAGNWQVGEIRRTTTRQEGDNRSAEEQVSIPDSEGKLDEVSRTVSDEAATASGEKSSTVETYSIRVPGSVGDGSLHLVKRATTARIPSSTGPQTIKQQVVQANPAIRAPVCESPYLPPTRCAQALPESRPHKPFKCATQTAVSQ